MKISVSVREISLLISIIFLLIAYLPVRAQSSGDMRPNIIVIVTDDQRWDAAGYTGNNIIETPNLDRLSQSGITFNNAFVTTPICAASRASIFTGLYERTHGFTFATDPLSTEYFKNSYPALLKNAGYQTGFIGKFGIELASDPQKYFDYFIPLNQQGYFRLTGDGASTHTHLTDLIGEKTVEYLENIDKNRPFCLSISFHAPHAEDSDPEQYKWPERFDTLYKNIRIPEPPLSEEKYFLEQPEYVMEGLNRIRWKWRFDTPDKYQKMVKGYYRMITTVDDNLGKIRKALRDLSLDNNTIIIYLSDNGYFLGERGFAGKWLMYDNSLGVPMVFYDPRHVQKGLQIDELTLNIDVAPTIMDLAGLKDTTKRMQGRSLLPLIGGDPEWRKDFMCEHLFEMEYIPQSEGIRTQRLKYFRYRDDPDHEELYDIEKDPLETQNLSRDPDFTKTLKALRKRCDDMIAELESQRLEAIESER